MLFETMKIGAVTAKNRVCIPPMVLFGHAGEDGMVTDAHIRHYEALARGGAGLMIQEATCVTPGGRLSRDQLGIWSDAQIAGLGQIVEAVHREGCPIFVQLHHAGICSIGPERLCPSAYVWDRGGQQVVGQAMTEGDLEAVRRAFIEGGRRAFAAGYDGVELHGCHSYLLCQFLNSRVNRRTDEYGRNPVKFIAEIIDGIRRETSPEFVIGIRLGGFEPTLADGLRHAGALESCGIQFFDISYGFAPEMDTAAPGDPELADTVRAAAAIKQAVSVPVFAVGKIRLPEDAERVLRETGVDMADVGRSCLVDPEWPNKAKAGKTPGKCLGCRVCQWRLDPDRCPGKIKLEREASR